jgi:hypothetical protein
MKLIYVFAFIIYEALSSIYLFLPPLLGVLFILFSNALKDDDTLSLLAVSVCLIILEADKGYLIFSTIIFFTFVHKLVLPKLIQNFNCLACIKSFTVIISYIGFYLFSLLISSVFLLPDPGINYYIVYYIVIEIFLVGLL